ncbi:MAG: hypothetical protein AAF557_11450 [Pseudomonadota bacterium]
MTTHQVIGYGSIPRIAEGVQRCTRYSLPIVLLAAFNLFTATPAATADKKAVGYALLSWQAFECSVIASQIESPAARPLLVIGLSKANQFFDAVGAGRSPRSPANRHDQEILSTFMQYFSFSTVNADFAAGAIFQLAAESAAEKIDAEEGSAAWREAASRAFDVANCQRFLK